MINKGAVRRLWLPQCSLGEAGAKQQMPLPFREPGMHLKGSGIKGGRVRIAVITAMKGKRPACRL